MSTSTSTPPALTITEAFDLPRPEDIRAMNFVVKLRDVASTSNETTQLVKDYVLTPAVQKELPRIFDDMKQRFDRCEEYGRFIHGSFGSGKSHFMTMLALLLEGSTPAWAKLRPLFAEHRSAQLKKGAAPDHEAWVRDNKLLVVRIHMLSVRGKTTSLDRAVYEGFNAALARQGKPAFEFMNVGAIFDEVRRDAAEYGDIVWERLRAADIVSSKADFDQLAAGSVKTREEFARAWLEHKGRNASDAGIDPRWSDGLARMTEHAKAHGYAGLVLMIDEFLIWLAEKTGREFVQEINNLNVIVDHTGAQRQLPVFVFVARQRDYQEFFPDLIEEAKIHEHLDHHSKRFEITKLEDVELRHIVHGRVLRPKAEHVAVVAAATASLQSRHEKILPGLIGNSDLGYLRDVYPFHPALIEMLVDVTSLMQRERSALRLLYELLVIHYPNLPLGEFLPVGSAFAAIFPEAGVEASKKTEQMADIHMQYYARLLPAMKAQIAAANANNDAVSPQRERMLDQLVKTVLLAEVSPRLKQQGLTIERLVQLNAADVEGETFRSQCNVAVSDLLALQQKVPDLQISGTGKTAVVRYVLGKVSLTEVLTRARSKVDNANRRLTLFWSELKPVLGLDKLRGFEDGSNVGDWDLMWRRTKRRGRVQLGNVREMAYEDFDPGQAAFAVLIDYPWDINGHSVEEDRMRADNVRKKLGTRFTACWLPRHMTQSEQDILTELAAVRYVQSDGHDLLDTLAQQDRVKILEQANIREATLRNQLRDLFTKVYVEGGDFHFLTDLKVTKASQELADNLEHIATQMMDRQFPFHPAFTVEPKKADLERLLQWMLQANDPSISVPFDDATGRVLETLGKQLELVNQGQTKASLRLDTRYIKHVLQLADRESVPWQTIADTLEKDYGLTPLVTQLFLAFLSRRDHRALQADGSPIEVSIGSAPPVGLRLERGNVVQVAQWGRLRELSEMLGVANPGATRSLQAQDTYAAVLQRAGAEKRSILESVRARLLVLRSGVAAPTGTERQAELTRALERLAPLQQRTTDSHKVLTELLAQWPDDAGDELRRLVRGAGALRDALARLDETGRSNLQRGENHPVVGSEVRAHLSSLDQRLAGSEVGHPLTDRWVDGWNQTMQALTRKLIEQSGQLAPVTLVATATVGPAPTSAVTTPTSQPAGPQSATQTLLNTTVDTSDAKAVTAFVESVRKALQAQSGKRLQLEVRATEMTGAKEHDA